MYKTIFLVLAIAASALATGFTSFELAPAGAVFSANEEKGYIYSYPQNFSRKYSVFAIPPDSGGNFGDNILYVGEGQLLVHEVRINIQKSASESAYQWKYTTNSSNLLISNARLVNLGRERAYVAEMKMPSDRRSVQAIIRVGANQQMRLLCEVYGKSAATQNIISWILIGFFSIIYIFLQVDM